MEHGSLRVWSMGVWEDGSTGVWRMGETFVSQTGGRLRRNLYIEISLTHIQCSMYTEAVELNRRSVLAAV